ncbi:PTS IIA-like nitrogen-regulatory protein PtsN [Olavius algarvensis associated proteobacterium Delta 3]|nr:PTS IIA-like nitrogen-regulatory protein PtsN [Olavius algarvensis associated proteobacterium Delta 3]CAB5153045.1 PTS IIA-like nitrogen-regulatory protein PtsN [Olavius algarvensis associated proteobacterium Delta 3]
MKLSMAQIAEHLDLPVQTVERWIRQGRIPVHREGRSCAFHRATLERWARAHNLTFSPPRSRRETPDAEASEKLENLLPVMQRGGVHYGLRAEGVASALVEVTARIPNIARESRDELLEGLLEREQLASTGIGNGIAIPHLRTPLSELLSEPVITTCFPARPVEFGAIDDRPVFVFFALLCPSVKAHLHLLSRLSYCARDNAFIEFLRSAPAEEDLFERIAGFEKQLEMSGM